MIPAKEKEEIHLYNQMEMLVQQMKLPSIMHIAKLEIEKQKQKLEDFRLLQ